MAKRSNPYAEDIVQQSKVHVGLKQFNNNEDRLQKVYEKTLHLLFKGARKPLEDNIIKNPDLLHTGKKDGKKQLFIGKDGSLLHSGNLAIEKSSTRTCLCGGPKSEACAYCEVLLCTLCQYPCPVCQMIFCSKCSLIGSEGIQICVSCYN